MLNPANHFQSGIINFGWIATESELASDIIVSDNRIKNQLGLTK
ncbi:hypothetical protein [Stieleria magnilauensis]